MSPATVAGMNEQPHPNRVRLLPWDIPDRLIDTVLTVLTVVGFVAREANGEGSFEPIEWIALTVAIVMILLRRRYPREALGLAIAAAAGVVAVTDGPNLLLPVALVLLFNVAQRFDRRTAIVAGAVTTAAFFLIITAVLRQDAFGGAGLAAIAWPAFAGAAGAAVRSARESVSTAEERALRAEESQDLEAQRRVIEERLRIAHDVHDLVAHHIAVINVQSAVAGHLMETDPPAAGEALDVVRSAASTVVDQLGELLGVLRSPEDLDEPTAPTPNLAAIGDLISSFAASGLNVRTETSGAQRPMSGLAELTAYRVVQEALTNAHKHGEGSATVSLRFGDDGLEVTVTNPINTLDPSHNHDGFGLIGMRERVEGVGGSLESGTSHRGQQFEVAATIPGKDHE